MSDLDGRVGKLEVGQGRHDERINGVEDAVGRISAAVASARNWNLLTLLAVLGAVLGGLYKLNGG